MLSLAKSRRGVRELCLPPSGNVESENTLSLCSAGGTTYPVLPQDVATGSWQKKDVSNVVGGSAGWGWR